MMAKPRCAYEDIEAQVKAFEDALTAFLHETHYSLSERAGLSTKERAVEDERAALLAMIKELHP